MSDELVCWTGDWGEEDVALPIVLGPGHGHPLVVVVHRRVELLEHADKSVVHKHVVDELPAYARLEPREKAGAMTARQ